MCLTWELEYVVFCGSNHVHVKNALHCVSLVQHNIPLTYLMWLKRLEGYQDCE